MHSAHFIDIFSDDPAHRDTFSPRWHMSTCRGSSLHLFTLRRNSYHGEWHDKQHILDKIRKKCHGCRVGIKRANGEVEIQTVSPFHHYGKCKVAGELERWTNGTGEESEGISGVQYHVFYGDMALWRFPGLQLHCHWLQDNVGRQRPKEDW